MVGDANISLRVMNRSPKQKNKESVALNDTRNQMDLVDTLRTFHPNTAEYKFFP